MANAVSASYVKSSANYTYSLQSLTIGEYTHKCCKMLFGVYESGSCAKVYTGVESGWLDNDLSFLQSIEEQRPSERYEISKLSNSDSA